MDIETEISLEIESKYVPGSNASNPKEKFEGKVSKRLSYFHGPPKKADSLTLYRVSHSEDLRILVPQLISIGSPTVKMPHFWTNFFERTRK